MRYDNTGFYSKILPPIRAFGLLFYFYNTPSEGIALSFDVRAIKLLIMMIYMEGLLTCVF